LGNDPAGSWLKKLDPFVEAGVRVEIRFGPPDAIADMDHVCFAHARDDETLNEKIFAARKRHGPNGAGDFRRIERRTSTV
jgi:hypothetical protein